MNVGKAVAFTTEKSQQFIQKSASITDDIADQIMRFAPLPSEVVDRNRDCLSFFWPTSDRIALARTFYSISNDNAVDHEGALTNVVIVEPDQLQGYGNNPALFAFIAKSEGALYFREEATFDVPELDLAETTIWNSEELPVSVDEDEANRISRAVEIHHQVAITGANKPLLFLASLLAEIPENHRREFTFAVNLWLSNPKSPKLLLYPELNDRIKKWLVTSQIRTISLPD